MTDVLQKLGAIVGKEYVSGQAEEQYIYSMDPGTMPPGKPDVVVMPGTTGEVSKIMKFASAREIPVVPMGAGLVLSGLTRALKGGIVLDMKRMNRIIEVNDISRYAVVEAGASQGMLQAYLKKHHPGLKHSVPDAPPIATVAGNVTIYGSGHLSHMAGFHSDMLNGLEVVLPDGEIVKIGSCATSDQWFARAPLPDLAGLFLGWAGTTGVVTKLSIKLYPDYPINDVSIFVHEDPGMMPDILNRLTGAQVAEDIVTWMTPKPDWAKGFQHCNVHYGAQSQEELVWKRNLLRASVKSYIENRTGGFMMLPQVMKAAFLDVPSRTLSRFADTKKGGGFEYVGAIMPVEKYPKAYALGLEVAEKIGTTYSMGSRIIGVNHCMMFFYAYAFNRADASDVENAQKALEMTNSAVIEMGGIPWKAEAPAQKEIIKKMDPGMFGLMNRIRGIMDPKGIMNPGNWEAD
ncbi:FAD-binding oxidoreductase [uncultured Desulfosarcina sp.]|uniref:FAD-binding oxidoreductase n=1 Tax=uncultured Desulfosarcina sp. TaxID=218289 RepID=UPI0029C90C7A|nr:FAD-binding oxidoreductase [uncultured Desulfosarcina sp.]